MSDHKIAQSNDANVAKLIRGYKKFYTEYYKNKDNDLFQELAKNGQKPKSMVICCSDSRIDPSKIFHCKPGDLFVIRNVANLVPPYDDNPRHHATSSALEFAIEHLKVHNIIILGHSQCGGIKSILKDKSKNTHAVAQTYIQQWMSIVKDACRTMARKYTHLSHEHQAHLCEEEALRVSLKNLESFICVKKAVDAGKLNLHAWHFNLSTGILSRYKAQDTHFEIVR